MATDMNKLRVERWAWLLIYGGLLSVVFSVFLERYARAWADVLQIGGSAVTGVGAALIWLRSRMN